ncbi:uncharacterized protein SETTUDRAFT_155245 [Exserohilum turcica Et28A]|uniref:Uncharacterized protein n=1 Tax=Exserohilum turcicum (strain 28A) TaxID=671987 RepID=R0JS08_EXST2|nr:uncharacterized protein SETTUDRAFT_155245 [Exserohilum turcica Et28A]EOA83903.1 hypothetical protein SETTUDRAFT_155245 [Exserohilum turcica Et28A]
MAARTGLRYVLRWWRLGLSSRPSYARYAFCRSLDRSIALADVTSSARNFSYADVFPAPRFRHHGAPAPANLDCDTVSWYVCGRL